MTQRLHVRIEGRVQGVGFRYATNRTALTFGLTGWVRNLPDGCVEAEFEGSREALEQMLDWCRQGPSFAHVTHVEPAWQSGEPLYSAFRIRG
jgi:acylphosphatase